MTRRERVALHLLGRWVRHGVRTHGWRYWIAMIGWYLAYPRPTQRRVSRQYWSQQFAEMSDHTLPT